MRILLDENLPRKLVDALRAEGHEVESVHTLRLQGLENGKLYQVARESFDLCFTRDRGFANNVRADNRPSRLKLLRVSLPQKPQDEFIKDFVPAFRPATGPSSIMATIGLDRAWPLPQIVLSTFVDQA